MFNSWASARLSRLGGVLAVIVSFLPSELRACAVCFGGADGNLIKGFTWGVAFLGSLPFLLLAALFTIIVRASRKAKAHD